MWCASSASQHLLQFSSQRLHGKWFRQQIDPGVEDAVMHDRVSCVTGCVEDLQIGHTALRFLGEASPVETWQPDIGEQERNLRVLFEEAKSRPSIRSLQDGVAESRQRLGAIRAHPGIVLD